MMTNLFSIFDTSTSMMFNLNWLSSIMILLILPMMFWLMPSKLFFLFNKTYLILFNELTNILTNKYNYMNSIMFISLFFMILINNIFGLFPYIFTSSSHMIFSMSISITLWISLITFNMINNFNHMFSHMIPQSTPIILMPFMVLIESISNIIRPMTLTIRLTANIIAGHLLLTLLSETTSNIPNFLMMYTIIMIQTMLLILEINVSIIQSYVFMILSTLYMKETN